MDESFRRELLDLSRQLLDCISRADWETYQKLCDPSLTCFEPESGSHQVEGLEFHRFYFDLGSRKSQSTICSPRVRMLGEDAAVVSYTRLVQSLDASGSPRTAAFEETRVWRREAGSWRHVHFHRSANSAGG